MRSSSETPASASTDDARIRDHLANERTYLAWTRTGIATMGLGVVIARLRYLFPAGTVQGPSRGIVHAANIGLIFAVIGLLTVIIAAWRFEAVRLEIREQRYRSSSAIIRIFSFTVGALGILIVWYLITASR